MLHVVDKQFGRQGFGLYAPGGPPVVVPARGGRRHVVGRVGAPFRYVVTALILQPDAGAVGQVAFAAAKALGNEQGDQKEPRHPGHPDKNQNSLDPVAAVSALAPGGASLRGCLSSSSGGVCGHVASHSVGYFLKVLNSTLARRENSVSL